MPSMEPTLLWSFLTFLLGLLIGHWLSLGRDRRKEFNDLSRETYTALIHHINTRRIDKISIDTHILAPYFWPIIRGRFISAVEQYNKAEHGTEYDPSTGTAILNERCADHIVQCARNVAKYLVPR